MELAEIFEKRYGLPKDKVEAILYNNENLDIVKLAKNRDFISQNNLAFKIKKLLNIKPKEKINGTQN
jgi:hypothetical protein